MDKEQKLYDKFVDTLLDVLNDKPSAQHLSVILNFLKYTNSQKDDEKSFDEEVFNGVQIKLPFNYVKESEVENE